MYYVIKNKLTNDFLKREDGSIVKESTIQDAFDYLLYVLNVEDTNIFEILVRTKKEIEKWKILKI